jgi:serine-type D-Ala-D-Ala endopeptidase (penicillin-binding protein 7)
LSPPFFFMKTIFTVAIIVFGFISSQKLNISDRYAFKADYDFPTEKYSLSSINPYLNAPSVLVGETVSGKIIIAKNENETRSIASVTKLVTALTILNKKQDLDEPLEITAADIDTLKGSTSHIPDGAIFTRGELLNLALMSSENRAALCLARNYPGGTAYFALDMNRLCHSLGTKNSYFVDPAGLNPINVSSAADLFKIVRAAYCKEIIRDFTTLDDVRFQSKTGKFRRYFNNTDSMVTDFTWNVKLSKTGYILEAGRCLALVFEVNGKDYTMILLGESSVAHRDNDAETIKKWVKEVIK